jgi:hypothetical protein
MNGTTLHFNQNFALNKICLPTLCERVHFAEEGAKRPMGGKIIGASNPCAAQGNHEIGDRQIHDVIVGRGPHSFILGDYKDN